MNRRASIAMDAAEVAAFLREQRTVACATIGRDGWPHVMPLWYVVREHGEGRDDGTGGAEVWAWTYAASQKTRNLERDPRATLQIEAGETYELLRGVMIRCETAIHRDVETVSRLGLEILTRGAGPAGAPPQAPSAEMEALVGAQARRRVGLQFLARSVASFDHRKLGGVY
ncbi:MAG: pyridoxamine 5'-phosphate oxidase family protein [Solirubrobacteraceae bacterium]